MKRKRREEGNFIFLQIVEFALRRRSTFIFVSTPTAHHPETSFRPYNEQSTVLKNLNVGRRVSINLLPIKSIIAHAFL